MVLAAPPETPRPRKAKKSSPLPDGMEQRTLDGLFAPLSEARQPDKPQAPAGTAPPVEEQAAGLKQLGFFSLIA